MCETCGCGKQDKHSRSGGTPPASGAIPAKQKKRKGR